MDFAGKFLQEILESFKSTEFWYADSVHERPSNVMMMRELSSSSSSCGGEEVWIPVAKVASCGLSERARRHLSGQREAANQILKAAKSINEHVLSEMEIPETYWKSLPRVKPAISLSLIHECHLLMKEQRTQNILVKFCLNCLECKI